MLLVVARSKATTTAQEGDAAPRSKLSTFDAGPDLPFKRSTPVGERAGCLAPLFTLANK